MRKVFAAFVLLASIIAAPTVGAQSLRFEHGHLIDLPVVFIDEEAFWNREFAFLAIKLPTPLPEPAQAVDYTQKADYFPFFGGAESVRFATISRTVWTDQASSDGWIILPLRKPCAPGQDETRVGRVVVCPPRADSQVVDGCTLGLPGMPLPVYAGEPEETVRCTARTRKRRSVGR